MSAGDIWSFAMPDSRSAQAVLLATDAQADETWREHGMDAAAPLVDTPGASRVAGAQTQTITTVAGTVTVQRT